MTLGAFGVIIGLRTADRGVETVEDLAGLGSTQPLPALALAICLLSLSGIPPLAGFWGKFEIFASAFAASPEDNSGPFTLLAVIGVLNAAVGAYYYLRIVVTMYLRPARQTVVPRGGWPVALAVGACASLSLILGLFPAPIARASRAAALAAVTTRAPAQPQVAVRSGPSPSRPRPRFHGCRIDCSSIRDYTGDCCSRLTRSGGLREGCCHIAERDRVPGQARMSCRRAGYRRATNLRLSAHRGGKHSASFREARPVPFDVVKVVEAMDSNHPVQRTRNWRQSSGHSGNQAPLLPTYSSSLQTDLMPRRASGSICCESTSNSAGNEANRGRCSRTSESFRKSPSVPTLSGCSSRATRRAGGTPGPSPSTCSRESKRSIPRKR